AAPRPAPSWWCSSARASGSTPRSTSTAMRSAHSTRRWWPACRRSPTAWLGSMKPASPVRRSAEGPAGAGRGSRAAGGSAALLAEMAAIAGEQRLEPALERMARLVAGLAGARTVALFVVEGAQLAAAGWHVSGGELDQGLREEIETAAR